MLVLHLEMIRVEPGIRNQLGAAQTGGAANQPAFQYLAIFLRHKGGLGAAGCQRDHLIVFRVVLKDGSQVAAQGAGNSIGRQLGRGGRIEQGFQLQVDLVQQVELRHAAAFGVCLPGQQFFDFHLLVDLPYQQSLGHCKRLQPGCFETIPPARVGNLARHRSVPIQPGENTVD